MVQIILVALDDSQNAIRAVEQIAKTCIPDNQITLFSVLPQPDRPIRTRCGLHPGFHVRF